MDVSFEFYFGDNTLVVDAEVTPGFPAQQPSLNDPGCPADDPDVEFKEIVLSKDGTFIDFDIEGLVVATRTSKIGAWPVTHRYEPLEDLISQEAIEEAAKDQDDGRADWEYEQAKERRLEAAQ